jgi:hypothetical protein
MENVWKTGSKEIRREEAWKNHGTCEDTAIEKLQKARRHAMTRSLPSSAGNWV